MCNWRSYGALMLKQNGNRRNIQVLLVGEVNLDAFEKATGTPRSVGLVLYPVDAVLLNCLMRFKPQLLKRCFTLVGSLPVQCAEEECVENPMRQDTTYVTHNCYDGISVLHSDSVQLTSSLDVRMHKDQVVHGGMQWTLQSFLDVSLKELIMTCEDRGTFCCFLRVVSFCCHISGSRNISGIRHGMTVVCPCIRWPGGAQKFLTWC